MYKTVKMLKFESASGDTHYDVVADGKYIGHVAKSNLTAYLGTIKAGTIEYVGDTP